MHLLEPLWQFLVRLVNALRPSFLEVVDEGPHRLEIESNYGRFVVDARRRLVTRNGRQVATFDQIKFVDVTKKREFGEFTEWSIVLYVNLFKRVRVGECRNDVLVSVIGAKLVTLTGAKPLGWNERFDIPM